MSESQTTAPVEKLDVNTIKKQMEQAVSTPNYGCVDFILMGYDELEDYPYVDWKSGTGFIEEIQGYDKSFVHHMNDLSKLLVVGAKIRHLHFHRLIGSDGLLCTDYLYIIYLIDTQHLKNPNEPSVEVLASVSELTQQLHGEIVDVFKGVPGFAFKIKNYQKKVFDALFSPQPENDTTPSETPPTNPTE